MLFLKTNSQIQSVVIVSLTVVGLTAMASDHIDGPETRTHPVSDITDLYAYPSATEDDVLTLIMNVYPLVLPEGHFSNLVTYSFVLRQADIAPDRKGFTTNNEVRIDCTFNDAHEAHHSIKCQTSTGKMADAEVNVIEEQGKDDFHVFAGHRTDPFFFDATFSGATAAGKLTNPAGENLMSRLNVLSIVIDIKMSDFFAENPSSLVAVAAQTSIPDPSSDARVKLDRVGRPEITNVSLVTKKRKELRDSFNRENPFAVAKLRHAYVDRLSTNIMEYDMLDGPNRDWGENDIRDWATLLADDFLVLDTSKGCDASNYRETAKSNFLEIEKALMDGAIHTTCGGRHPYNDIMDRLFTLYITADKKDPVGDRVDEPYKPLLPSFPYLDRPDFSISAIDKVRRLKAAAAAEE